jgi:hypothetical protein
MGPHDMTSEPFIASMPGTRRTWMDLRSGMASVGLVALSVLATTPAHAQPMSRETFLVMDIDEDGQVDAVEFGVVMGAAFAHADKNSDGILTADEAKVLSLPPAVDANGDGQVSMDEFLTSVRNDFKNADRDKDGIVRP